MGDVYTALSGLQGNMQAISQRHYWGFGRATAWQKKYPRSNTKTRGVPGQSMIR
jgi:hypothetical protein